MNSNLTLLAATIAFTALSSFAATSANAFIKPTHERPRPAVTTTYKCGSELGYMKRVYETEVEGLERVSIVPMCDGEDYGLMRSDGNAGALRLAMADNAAVMEALDGANFRVEDIIGIRMTGDEKAIIYVHTFHR